MPIQPRPLAILRRQPVQRIRHISPHILIPVLIQAERATGVLDEEIQQSDFVGRDLRERGGDVVGYEVGAPCGGGEREGLLEPGHGVCRVVWGRGRAHSGRHGLDASGGASGEEGAEDV